MRKFRVFLLMLCVLVMALSASALTLQAQDAALLVNAADAQGEISPYVYGSNYGPWNLIPVDMQPLAAESGITHFRFPGGNYGDQFRASHSNIDLFMMQARAWGVEPSISVRMEGGTPEQAAEVVNYVNVVKGYNIRQWSIGNEPDLFDGYTVERFNEEWRAFADAMEAVDPSIELIGPDVSQFPSTIEGNEYLNVRREWVRSFLEANGDRVDIVSVHRYPFPTSNSAPPTTIADLRTEAPNWDTLVENLRAVIQDAVGHEMPMAITEANSNWTNVIGGDASPDTLPGAIWWADVLGRLIRQRLTIVDHFAFFSSGDIGGGMGLIGRSGARPVYYVYQMYRQFGTNLIASASTDPDVSITAALRDDGALTVMIVNRAEESRTLPLEIASFTASGDATAWRLDSEHNGEEIGTVALSEALEIPPLSVTLYVIPG